MSDPHVPNEVTEIFQGLLYLCSEIQRQLESTEQRIDWDEISDDALSLAKDATWLSNMAASLEAGEYDEENTK